MFPRPLAILLVLLVLSMPALAGPTAPVTDGPEGKRAFEDLAAFYADTKVAPPFPAAFEDLKSPDPAVRSRAGAYLTALFRQLFADEGNGRSPWRSTPFWGGRPSCDAREFRKSLAQAFAAAATGEEAIDPALWLLESEKLAEGQAAGMEALRRIQGPRAQAAFAQLLDQPHPNADVARMALEEAGKRGWKELAPAIARLCGHYRTRVREAARAAASALGLPAPAAFVPEQAFTPWLEERLREIASLVITPIPEQAEWQRFHFAGEAAHGRPDFEGWRLGEEGDTVRVVTWFGLEERLAKKEWEAKARPLAEAAADLVKRRASGDVEGLSPRGGLTAQFEPKYLALPEALVAAWCFARGDRAGAAAVAFPRIDAAPDDRWFGWIARDLIGHVYHQAMLAAFSHERDIAGTLAFARHLAKPIFTDYQYHGRAVQMAEQLAQRVDDFTTLRLPTPEEWRKLQAGMPRDEQIHYLAGRLRVLNCIQQGQPGDVSYEDPQFAEPSARRAGAGTPVINPFHELRAMALDLADLPALAKHLGDESFMPTFGYWRDFHPKRTLHQANWAVASILNEVAKRDLAELNLYFAADAAGKVAHLAKVMQWCVDNVKKKRDDLPDLLPKKNEGGPQVDAPK